MITKNVKLYLGDGFPVRIPVSQYDTMWRFVFSIINGSVEWTIPAGATAVLNGRKPDGNVIAISGTIGDNKVTVDATEQMTVVAGEVVCELSIMSGGAVVGTANFTLAVEGAPKKDGEPTSESDLSAYAEMIEAAGELVGEAQEIIAHGPFLPSGGTPGQVLTKTANGTEWDDVSGLPDGGNNGQVLTKTSGGAEWSDAGTPTQAQTDSAVADWLDAHPEATTTVQDGSITEQKLDPLLTEKVNGGGISDAVKVALLALLAHVAYIDENGQTYYDALEDALYPPAELVSISALYTQSGTVYDTDTLDSLKADLVVTAYYDDYSSETITAYTLSGTLTEGTSTVTVSYDGKTATFNVFVTKGELDTTAQIATEGYVTRDISQTHDTVAIANGGITIAYEMDAPSTALAPAGVIVQSGILSTSTGTIRVYNGETAVTYADEVNRWGKTPASSYTEYSQSWSTNEYDRITFSLDTRYLDDSYMYDGITGQVWFAGRNTPFYGMTNVSEAYGELPDGYTKLSYVKSTGEQHINTGYTPTPSTKFYIDAQTRTAGTSAPGGQDEGNTQRTMFEAINGTSWAGNSILLAPYRVSNSATGYWGWYNASTTKQIYIGDVDDDRHNLTLVRDAYKIEGTLNWNGTLATPSTTYTYPVSLFGFLRNGTYSHMNDDMTLYAFRIYEGKDSSIPTANLVPCKDPNNVVGLYDTIRREFYHSTTGTELIGGEAV